MTTQVVSLLRMAEITPVILTLNEEANIDRALACLRWASEVVVVDSGSTDRTLEICATFSNVRVLHRPFDSHAAQWNFAIQETGIVSDWVLALDADYALTQEFVLALGQLTPSSSTSGYRTTFRYCVFGRQLSGSLYPPVVTFFRRERAHFVQDGHTQRVVVDGEVAEFSVAILHDDRKPLSTWFASQVRYAELGAAVLLTRGWSDLRWQDRLRKMLVITPWLVPLYCMTVGKGLLDGWHGVYYALQRAAAETVLSLKLLEMSFLAKNRGK